MPHKFGSLPHTPYCLCPCRATLFSFRASSGCSLVLALMDALLVNAGAAVAAVGQSFRPDADSLSTRVGQPLSAQLPPSRPGAAAVGSVATRRRDGGRTATPVERLIVDHCIDKGSDDDDHDMSEVDMSDDAEEDESVAGVDREGETAAAQPLDRLAEGIEEQSGGRSETADGHPAAAVRGSAPSLPLEPVFEFSALPSLAQLKHNKDPFTSTFMELIVRIWPQAPVTKTSRRANAVGADCIGARPRSAKGTDADVKTWASRIHTAVLFANFIGRTICIPVRGQRPSDAEIDRGVAKFFAFLNPFTQEFINLFLDARRRGYAVAGGGQPLKEKTVRAYSAGLKHLFTRARMSGTTGPRVVPDCIGAMAPWQKKGLPELEKEQREVRADAGLYIGNPMQTEEVRDHKSSAEREARQAGQHTTTSGNMTPSILLQLHNDLIATHMPADKSISRNGAESAVCPPVAGAQNEQQQQAAPAAPVVPAPAAGTSRSTLETNFLAFFFYAFLFVRLARPVTLLNLLYEDITLPNPLVAANAQFLNRCVWKWSSALSASVASGRALCHSGESYAGQCSQLAIFRVLASFVMTCFAACFIFASPFASPGTTTQSSWMSRCASQRAAQRPRTCWWCACTASLHASPRTRRPRWAGQPSFNAALSTSTCPSCLWGLCFWRRRARRCRAAAACWPRCLSFQACLPRASGTRSSSSVCGRWRKLMDAWRVTSAVLGWTW